MVMRNGASVTVTCVAAALCLRYSLAHAHGSGGDHSEGDEIHLRNKDLIVTKVWCLIIAFIATFLSGISPYFLRWHPAFLLLGTQFAGGVFLGTALMHFLADANETFGDRTSKSYPFAYMLATAGYLLTMFGDCIISSVYDRNKAQRLQRQHYQLQQQQQVELGGVKDNDAAAAAAATAVTAGIDMSEEQQQRQRQQMSSIIIVKEASLGDSLLLIIALCFHSVFEGLAIGVSASERDAWRNLWTICLHKLFAAIAMGIALLRILPNRPLLSTALYAFAFAISTPIGVAIGIIIDATTQGSVADWIYAISMGIACGVFIYVAINHLLARKSSSDSSFDTPLNAFMAAVLGAGVIAVVMIWD